MAAVALCAPESLPSEEAADIASEKRNNGIIEDKSDADSQNHEQNNFLPTTREFENQKSDDKSKEENLTSTPDSGVDLNKICTQTGSESDSCNGDLEIEETKKGNEHIDRMNLQKEENQNEKQENGQDRSLESRESETSTLDSKLNEMGKPKVLNVQELSNSQVDKIFLALGRKPTHQNSEIDKKTNLDDENEVSISEIENVEEDSNESCKKSRTRVLRILDSDSENDESEGSKNNNNNVKLDQKKIEELLDSESEKEEDKNVPKKSRLKKKAKFKGILQSLDSDSENGDSNKTKIDSILNLSDDSNSSNRNLPAQKKRIIDLLDSDSGDDDNKSNVESPSKEKEATKSGGKTLTLVDSDSEGEVLIFGKKKKKKSGKEMSNGESEDSTLNEAKKSKSSKLQLLDSESEDEEYENRKKTMNNLLDSESDNESPMGTHMEHADRELSAEGGRKKSEKRRKGTIRAAKDEAMKQIHSETQRLMRESYVSLPYHKPKQRTLQEFLNRKKINASLIKAPTVAAKVKQSSVIISKVVEEKEKEAELFYKSSDSEDENPTEFQNDDKKTQEANSETHSYDIEPENKSSELQNNHAVRKLFDEDSNNSVNLPIESEISKKDATNSQNDIETFMDVDDSSNKSFDSIIKSLENEIKNNETEDSSKKEKENNLMETETEDFSLKVSQDEFDSTKNTEVQKLDETKGNTGSDSKDILDGVDGENLEEDASKKGGVLGLPLPEFEDPFERRRNSEKSKDPAFKLYSDEITSKASAINENNSLNAGDTSVPRSEDALGKPKIKKKLLPLLPTLKPKLRGSPGMMIDFSDNMKPDKEGINNLMDRFFKHNVPKVPKPTEGNCEVSVLQTVQNPDGLQVVKEVLPYKLPVVEKEDPDLNKPGAKLLRLKEDLKQKMAQKRNEEWKQKEELEKNENEEDEDEEKEEFFDERSNCGFDEDEELTESEPEENDIVIKEKKRRNCSFADEEAEVSGEEIEEGIEEDEEEENEEEKEEESEKDDNELSDFEKEGGDDEEESSGRNKERKLKRIVKAFEEDSNESKAEMESKSRTLERTRTDVDMFENDDGNHPWESEADIEANPMCSLKQDSKDILTLSLGISPLIKPTQETVLDEKRTNLSNKLFENESESVNDDELLSLCSGKFPTQVEPEEKKLFGLINNTQKTENMEAELLDLCSGSFSTQFEKNTDSQDILLSLEDDTNSQKPSKSVEAPKSRKEVILCSSEDEDEVEEPKKTKKKAKRLELSDEEEEEEEEEQEESEIEESEVEEKFVDYDSEENEITVVSKKDIKKVAANFLEGEAELSESDWDSADEDERDMDKLEMEEGDNEDIDEDQMRDQLGKIHMKQILDEDQRDVRMLKELLFEDGDLHTDGSARERKFKWKNIDKLGDDDLPRGHAEDDDLSVDPQDDETDMEWRKLRLEREKFLEEKMKTKGDDDIEEELELGDSQLFKLGAKALKKSKINQHQKEDTNTSVTGKTSDQPVVPSIINDLLGKPEKRLKTAMQRGSFLARGDQCLARLALMVKKNDTANLTTGTGNFVFATVSPSVVDKPEVGERRDDEEEDNVLNNKGRKRKPTAGLTPRTAKKVKSDGNSRGKKLF